jgi:GWxTD domain-containing protein
MMKRLLLLFSALLICQGSLYARKLSRQNLFQLYDEEPVSRIEAIVYHVDPEFSTVYLNIQLSDFMYALLPEGEAKKARFSIDWVLYDSYESRKPLDSARLVFSDSLGYENPLEMLVNFDIQSGFPGNYILKITISDLNFPDKSEFGFFEIDKTGNLSRQNFLVTDQDGYVIFSNALKGSNVFSLMLNDTNVSSLRVRYYNREFPLAKPPFASEKDITYKFEPDSLFLVELSSGKSGLLQLPFKGIYHFQADPSKPEGLTLFRFDDGFPYVVNPEQAIAPLRYLSTEREFERMLTYPDYKPAIDSFWLQRASQRPERAKNMIRRFYTRVERANILFTSYHEGWKTDRGLIYIIYGPPTQVYRKTGEEDWIYGERDNPMSLRFSFTKADNLFTDNDYRLNRSTIYKSSWFIAIENWRR